MSEGGVDDDKGMVSDIEGVRSLGGREMMKSTSDGICVWVVRCSLALLGLAEAISIILIIGGSPFCFHGSSLAVKLLP